jgi:hypothetical protein
MINPIKSMIVVGCLLVVSEAIADPCERQPNTSVEVIVEEAPIVIMQDITLADLEAMSTRLKRQLAHPVLGPCDRNPGGATLEYGLCRLSYPLGLGSA